MAPLDRDMPLVKRTVLVVDDRRMARRIATRILSEEGFRVLEADGSEEALEVLAQAGGRVDVVVVDVVLHGGDGVALARDIHAEWPDQRILYMSAFPAQVMAQYGLTALDVPFLAKPFTCAELLAKVAEAMGQPRASPAERRKEVEP